MGVRQKIIGILKGLFGLSTAGGVLTSTGRFVAPNGTAAAPSYALAGNTGSGVWYSGTFGLSLSQNGVHTVAVYSGGTLTAPTLQYAWNGNAFGSAAVDTGLARDAAGVVRVTDGGAGTGTLKASVNVAGTFASTPATAQDVATGNTVTLPAASCTKRLTATAGAATGVILTAGTVDGQELTLINVHATNAITFAAAATSNVADGVSSAVAALTATTFVWDATSARWFHMK